MSKDITFNVGTFKLLKSNISLGDKNFIGYGDDDYEIVSLLNSSNINIASNDSVYVKNNVYIGFNNQEIKDKININTEQIKQAEQPEQPVQSEQNNLIVKGNSELDGDVIVSGGLFVKNNCFLNQDIFINNTLNLSDEDISKVDFFKINNINISLQSYKYLLSNILENIKIMSGKQICSLKFINQTNFIVQSILSVNKKFIYNKNIINCYLLTYVLYNKNIIIDVKPIMDTFSLINDDYKLIKIIDE
jgi:hypothetical protein